MSLPHNLLATLRSALSPRLRRQRREQLILDALASGRERAGLELQQATGLHTGTFYVAVDRLERSGQVTSRWGRATAGRGGRRPRLYRVVGQSSAS